LDEVAATAGVSRVLIYRHFESKTHLYRALLDDIRERLVDAITVAGGFGPGSIDGLVAAAQADPDGFVLLFRHARREPEFRDYCDQLFARMAVAIERNLEQFVQDPARRRWAATVAVVVTVETIIGWLDAGCPEPNRAAAIVRGAVAGVMQAIARRGG
jgi:AcrR family transcriptional regulator